MRRVNIGAVVVPLQLPAYHRRPYQVGIEIFFFKSSDYLSVAEHCQRVAFVDYFVKIVRNEDDRFILFFHAFHKSVYYIPAVL